MTLLITIFAAVASTTIWYSHAEARRLKVGTLCLMYWGASLMWLVDAVAEYFESGEKYFSPSAGDMLNDAFLGLSVTALGLVIWLAIVFIKDPNHVIADKFSNRK